MSVQGVLGKMGQWMDRDAWHMQSLHPLGRQNYHISFFSSHQCAGTYTVRPHPRQTTGYNGRLSANRCVYQQSIMTIAHTLKAKY